MCMVSPPSCVYCETDWSILPVSPRGDNLCLYDGSVRLHPYCATMPPSTGIGKPVTNDAASEHSHTTASAISSGFPIRPTGSTAAILSALPALWAVIRSTIGVLITPGHTAFTRIPDLAYSNAAVLVSPTTPCLLAT